MTNPWVCIDCGARQADQGVCRACGHGDTLDARQENVRELMRDVDLRLSMRLESRLRFLGVGIAMVIVIGLWTQSWWWELRSHVMALPMLMDQFLLMAAIGIGVIKVGQKLLAKRRFPYLDLDGTITG